MKLPALLMIIICTCLTFAGVVQAQEDVAEVLAKGTYAVNVNKNVPKFPYNALRDGVEGWVIVRLAVKKDGTTDAIEVYDSSIEGYFEDTAIEAAKNRTYKPATSQGYPVMQGNVLVRYVFTLGESEGRVSKPFLKTYKKAKKAIEAEDLDLAKIIIDQLDRRKKRVLAEVCYLDMLKGKYFEKKGDNEASLYYIERALWIADTEATPDIYANLLWQAVKFNGITKNYQTSLKHYNTLTETDKDLALDDPIHNFVSKVRQVLEGNSNIVISGEISACATCKPPVFFWERNLNRNRFSIDQLVGAVNEIEVQCKYGSVSLTFEPKMEWSINKNWGECFLRVFGENGTTLQLVEFPIQSL